MPRLLRFSFDFVSPYAYLGWLRVHDFAARHQLGLVTQPVLFAAMLDAWGHRGSAEIPPKRAYAFKHALRLAADSGVPLVVPREHPFNPLLGLRLASLELPASQRRTLIDVLFARVWALGRGITDPAEVAEALTGAGLDGALLVKLAGASEAKQRLREATDAAIERGLFGVPTLEVEGELFWGQDSFAHVSRFLSGQDPVPTGAVERWRDLPAQSQRRLV